MYSNFPQLINRALSYIGLRIHRTRQDPMRTLLGLRTEKIDLILDVGANEGQFAQWMQGIFKQAEIHCFEPVPETFAKLKSWSATTNSRVFCHPYAVAEANKTMSFNVHLSHSSSSSLLPTTSEAVALYPEAQIQKAIPVDCIRLDDFLQSSGMDISQHKTLLKIDVQGYEHGVLKGAEQTLGHVHACIIELCVKPLYEGQAQMGDLCLLLESAGLFYAGNLDQAYSSTGSVISLDMLFLRKESHP